MSNFRKTKSDIRNEYIHYSITKSLLMFSRPIHYPIVVPKPSNERRLVIGDVHGCFYTLKKLVEDHLQLTKTDQLFLLGDYIDKGNHSAKVLDYLIHLIREGYQVLPLRGNHEEKLLLAYENGADVFEFYMENYNCEDLLDGDVPQYLKFCNSLPYCIETEGFLLSHAGFSQTYRSPFSDTRSLFGRIDLQVSDAQLDNNIFIKGHVATTLTMMQNLITQKAKSIRIDGGCVYKDIEEFGYLCALNLDTMELITQKNIEI